MDTEIDKLINQKAKEIAVGRVEEILKEQIVKGAVEINAPTPEGQHPYEQMCEAAIKKYPHCAKEIIDFFAVENERNMDQDEVAKKLADPAAYKKEREFQWAYFFQTVKEINTQRTTVAARSKQQEKKIKKGKKLGAKPFNGPTIFLGSDGRAYREDK